MQISKITTRSRYELPKMANSLAIPEADDDHENLSMRGSQSKFYSNEPQQATHKIDIKKKQNNRGHQVVSPSLVSEHESDKTKGQTHMVFSSGDVLTQL